MHNALSKHQSLAGSRPNPSSNSAQSMSRQVQVQLQPCLQQQQLAQQRHWHPQIHCRVLRADQEYRKGSNDSSSKIRTRHSHNQPDRTDEYGHKTAVPSQPARGTLVAAAAVLPVPQQHLDLTIIAQPQQHMQQQSQQQQTQQQTQQQQQMQQQEQQQQQQQQQQTHMQEQPQQQPQQQSAPLLQALEEAEQQQQQQLQQHQLQQQLIGLLPYIESPKAKRSSSQGLDPSALPITDRVRLLTSNAAARRRTNRFHSLPGGLPVNVSTYCAQAGLSAAASNALLQHVRAMRISSAPEALGPFVAAYKRLAGVYGECVAVCWLRKAPPIIRAEDEVPGRLAQLQALLGPSASLGDALAVTKRCPQVLQVSRYLLVHRMQQLCSLLGKDPVKEAGRLLVAAPALLAMQPNTLEQKYLQLQMLSNTHSSWSGPYMQCPSKSLAVLLTYSLQRQLRLHYAAAHRLQEKLQMNTIMALSKAAWIQAHPDFEDWCRSYDRMRQLQAAAVREQQPGPSVQPLGGSGQPPGASVQPSGASAQPSGQSAQPSGTSGEPSWSSVQPPGASLQQPGASVQPLGVSVQPPGVSVQLSGASVQPLGTSGQPPGASGALPVQLPSVTV